MLDGSSLDLKAQEKHNIYPEEGSSTAHSSTKQTWIVCATGDL